jgi:hypothetical protein
MRTQIRAQSKRYFCGAFMTGLGNSNKTNLFRALSDTKHASAGEKTASSNGRRDSAALLA